jgi:hypothetical protein
VAPLKVIGLNDAVNQPAKIWDTGLNPWQVKTNVTHDNYAAAFCSGFYNAGTSWLETRVVGPATLSFWWKATNVQYKEFVIFQMDSNEVSRITGAVNWQQVLVDVPSGEHTMRWLFTNSVFNFYGTRSGAWVDEVVITPTISPLHISQDPSSQQGLRGDTITFSVGIEGGEPYYWQWFFNTNQSLLSGTNPNPTLILPNIGLKHIGYYSLVATNALGAVTSAPAQLRVLHRALQPILAEGGSGFRLSVDTESNFVYWLEAKSNLLSADWTVVCGVTNTNGLLQLQDPSTNSNFRFYRIGATPTP